MHVKIGIILLLLVNVLDTPSSTFTKKYLRGG